MSSKFTALDSSKLDLLEETVARQILEAVSSLRYGAVEVTIHDGRVVQIDRRERMRLAPPGK